MVRSSFWVGFGSSRSRVAVPFRRVVGCALAAGCSSWLVRSSVRSFSGSVVWAFFVSRSSAAAFALRCSALVGFSVCVRPSWVSGVGFCWVVSVPVVR